MKIQIDEHEIAEAVECYLARQGVAIDQYDLTINVIAGRTETGPRVEINMEKKDLQVEKATVPTKADPFAGSDVTKDNLDD